MQRIGAQTDQKKKSWITRFLQLRSKLEEKDRELREQVHFLQTLIDVIPAPIFYKDVEGEYRGCNKAFESYIGINKNQIVGKTVFDLAPAKLASKYQEKDDALFNNPGIQIYENHVVYADGSEHDVIFNKATYTNTHNKVAGLVGVITDITKHKRAERALKETSQKLIVVLDQIVHAMAAITEIRDMYTAGHQQRVSDLAGAIGQELGLAEGELTAVKVAGMLHDIGKIAVPAEILTKPGKLTFHELGIVKNHAQIGYDILKTIEFPWPIADIVIQHHERLNGSGYPNQLKGSAILLEAQIIAVADVVEAMSSHRPYRPSLGVEQAIAEIDRNRGILYNADVVDACIKVVKQR